MFRWESALTSHLAAVHGQHGKLHSCEFCGKQFKTNDSLGCLIKNYHAGQYRPKQPKPKAGQETGTSTSKQNAKKNS